MPRFVIPDQRFDFSGGVNRSRSQDSLDARELRYARNMRRDEFGSVRKRPGSKRLHSDELGSGAAVLGLRQWQNPSAAEELIAVCGGNLYHKSLAATSWTEKAGTLSTSVAPRFEEHREGAAIVLYLAEGNVNKWDGTTLDESIAGAPNALDLAIYKGRLFASDGTKELHWTQINEPENWADGASADVETFDTHGILGLLTMGSSLGIWKRNSVARYTGVSQSTIRIDTETEGISDEVGLLAPLTLIRAEGWAFFVSDRGPYLADEAGVYFIGPAIERYLRENVDREELAGSVASYDRGTRKILWMYPTASSNGENAEGWLLDMQTRTWEGPLDFQGFNAASLARIERADKSEAFMVGGYDGFVRDGWSEPATWKDDVLSDGTGGTAVPARVDLPDLLGGDPGRVKSLRADQTVRCDLDDDGALVVVWTNEDGDTATLAAISSTGAGVRDYRFRSKAKGTALSLSFREETASDFKFNGISLQLVVGGRAA